MAFVAGGGQLSPKALAPKPLKTPASSSWIASFDYDPANLTLTTTLKSGAIYQHKMVTPIEYDELISAKSQAQFWTANIKGKKASAIVKPAKAPNAAVKGRK